VASTQGGKSPKLKNLLQNSSKMMQTGKPVPDRLLLSGKIWVKINRNVDGRKGADRQWFWL
jgi:hypothetical protein